MKASFLTPTDVRSEYHEDTRNIAIKGDLKLVNKETQIIPSNNLLPVYTKTYDNGETGTYNCNIKVDGGLFTVNSGSQGTFGGTAQTFQNFTLPAGTYTLSISSDDWTSQHSINKFGVNFGYKYSGEQWTTHNIAVVMRSYEGASSTITVENDIIITQVSFETYNDLGAYQNAVYKVMLNEGSTSLPFEQPGTHEEEVEVVEDFIIGENLVEHTISSTNKLPEFNKVMNYNIDDEKELLFEYKNGDVGFRGELKGNSIDRDMLILGMSTFTLPAGTYTFSVQNKKRSNKLIKVRAVPFFAETTLSSDDDGIVSQTTTFNSDTTIVNFGIEVGNNFNQDDFDDEFCIMLNEGSTILPFEKSGTHTEYVDETNCQILDLNVDEKADIYYESMPFAEMSLDVENTQGYFSDFTENSITSKLNKNCYLDLYLNANDTGWRKAWTMQFDSLTATNERATLKFKPYCVSIYNSMLYDKNKEFTTYPAWVISRFANYMLNNYDITLQQDNLEEVAISINKTKYNDVSNLLLDYGTLLSNTAKPQMLSIRDNKLLRYCVLYESLGEAIFYYSNLLDRPLITKENLDGYIAINNEVKSYSTDTYNYQKTINSNFINDVDTLVVYSDEYEFTGISSNDITLTNATLVSLTVIADGGVAGLGKHYMLLEISGVKGQAYTININANLKREEVVETKEEVYTKDKNVNRDSLIKLTQKRTNYWKYLVDNLQKKVKFRVPAIPYIQVGDCITLIDNETEESETYLITELHTSWSSGFIMEIVGYKVLGE